MNILNRIYWAITWMIYGSRLTVGKNAKFRMGGSIKGGGKKICIGDNFFIGKDFLLAVYSAKKDGLILQIGNNVVAQERVRISASESIIIGDNVLIGSDILITDNNHGMDADSEKSYMQQRILSESVKIGNGCWIGEKSIILPGSVIGEKAIIGAGSVVTGDIPAYTIAVGVPARPIKKWDFDLHVWQKM